MLFRSETLQAISRKIVAATGMTKLNECQSHKLKASTLAKLVIASSIARIGFFATDQWQQCRPQLLEYLYGQC